MVFAFVTPRRCPARKATEIQTALRSSEHNHTHHRLSCCSLPTGQKLPTWSALFEMFPPSLSSGGEGVVLTKLGSFFPQYPLEGFAGFERKILKISSFSTHLTETGEVVRFFGNFFLPLPTGEKWAVWPKRSETFSLQCPLDSSDLFERKIFIFSFLQYPLDKNHCFDQKDLKFFLPVPNGHEGPF